MTRVEKNLRILSETDRSELTMELNSHIYEGTLKRDDKNEIDVLLDVLAKLGAPEEFLKPAVAKKKLDQAVCSFNPKDIFHAIKLNLKNGVVYSVFGLLYLFLFSFGIIIVAKILFPGNTGLFFAGNSFRGFGYINATTGLNDVLGYWTIPLSMVSGTILYFCITLILRATRKK
jgi:uncharacterized membrane protein